MKIVFKFIIFSIILSGLLACGGGKSTQTSTTTLTLSKIQLGEKLFSDINLSLTRTQSCATCHDDKHAFVDPRVNAVFKAVSVGQDGLSFGDRNTPTITYAKFSPVFSFTDNKFVGGQFLEGREADLKGQAGAPFLNPVEMAMPDKASVVLRLQEDEEIVVAFKQLFGETIFEDTENAYLKMTESIAEFEKTDQFNTFDSKYDRSLRSYEGDDKYTLTTQERDGQALFFSEGKTNCNRCHQLRESEGAQQETFTNYEFHNLGVPANSIVRTANGKGSEFIDHGLLDNPSVDSLLEDGKFKIATLRNSAVTAPYMHNGIFKNLRTVILFYDKSNNAARINNPETGLAWRMPEVDANLALETTEFKAPSLRDADVDALIAFLKLLTDKRYEHLIEN